MLPITALSPEDGWCDASGNRNYNRSVRHPYDDSAERLWRSDCLYDIIIVVGYNDQPRRLGRGSAIFIHVAREGPKGLEPTEGCIALRKRDLVRLLPILGPATRLQVGD